jgi:osmotically-inducible protein OsmY
MYLLDPSAGKRRRTLLRDKFLHGIRSARDAMGVASRDVAHRSRGLLARAKTPFVCGAVPDSVLAERVRAQAGHVLSHPGAIRVSVRDGRVTLTGAVLAEEVRRLLKRVARVPGVTGVENELGAYETSA